jgi:hypothetical protein
MVASKPPSHTSRYFFKSWSKYSKTNVNFRSVWTTSYNRTMFGCRNSFNKEISRMAVDGIPSSSASNRMRFKAIIVSEMRSLALYTTPYVPSPIFSNFWYLSMASYGRSRRSTGVLVSEKREEGREAEGCRGGGVSSWFRRLHSLERRARRDIGDVSRQQR